MNNLHTVMSVYKYKLTAIDMLIYPCVSDIFWWFWIVFRYFRKIFMKHTHVQELGYRNSQTYEKLST